MNNFSELSANIITISACFSALIFLYFSIRINLFIGNRYEQETEILDTIYFREHANFTRLLPRMVSSPLYAAHLLSIIWMWDYCRKKKPYRDLEQREEILHLFSNKEIIYTKWFAISGLIIFIHVLIILAADLLSPDMFH